MNFDDRIQSRLAAEITTQLIAKDAQGDVSPKAQAIEDAVARYRRGDFTREEMQRIQNVVGGRGATVNYVMRIAPPELWLVVSAPNHPKVWYVLDWRCPKCKIDTVRQLDEVHYSCAVCGLGMEHFVRVAEVAR